MWLRLSSVPGDSQQPGFAQGGGHLQFDGTVATKERHGPIVVQIDDCCDFEVQIRDVNHGIGILGFMIDDEKERLAQVKRRPGNMPRQREIRRGRPTVSIPPRTNISNVVGSGAGTNGGTVISQRLNSARSTKLSPLKFASP